MKLTFLVICLIGFGACKELPINKEFDLNTLETRFASLLERVEDLEAKDFEKERKIKTLEFTVESLKNEISESETRWQTNLNELKSKFKSEDQAQFLTKHNLLSKKESVIQEVVNTSYEIEDSATAQTLDGNSANRARANGIVEDKTSTVHTRKEQRNKRQVNTRNVAFFATATPHDILNLGSQQNIVFDKEVTDIGNGYHNTHGTFSAPVAGTYVFFATVSGENGAQKEVYAHFDLNAQTICEFLVHPYEQSSQMVILQLKAGDDVSIQNSNAGNTYLGARFSTFSGFLLYPEGDFEVIG